MTHGEVFLSRDGANVCWLFSFFAIHEDYFRHIVCAIKLAKSFITLNSFRSVQYKAAVEMCSVVLCISCSRPMAEQWQYVQGVYVALPQTPSLWWAFFIALLCKTVVYLGDCSSAELGDFASNIRAAKQWKVSLKAPWQGKVTWNQIHGCRLLLHTSHVALMTLDIFWNFFVFVSHYWHLRHVRNPLLDISNVIRASSITWCHTTTPRFLLTFCFVANSTELCYPKWFALTAL